MQSRAIALALAGLAAFALPTAGGFSIPEFPLPSLRGLFTRTRTRCKRKFSRAEADKKFKAQCIARRANRRQK